ncbi:MAG TPA: glycosyltransferase family 87 protein [Cytophagaceae bacterium]|nr:glycosyltransferase family 87 protein [Cytophagaceae bacterium]
MYDLGVFLKMLPENKNKTVLFYIVPLIVLAFFFILKTRILGYSDFASYYFGSQQLLLGNYHQVYDTLSLNLFIQSLGYQDLFVSYTPFPPFTSVFFALFTLIPIETSKLLFNILSCTVFCFSLYRCMKFFALPPLLLLFIPLIIFTPIRSNIFFGQSYLLLFALLAEGYIAYKKNRPFLYSFFWGLAILFKVFPALILFFLLIKKEYRKIFYLSIACTCFLTLSIFVNGFSSWTFYLSEIFPRLNNGQLNDSYTFIFQSAFMFLKNIFLYDALLNPHAPCANVYLFWFLLASFKAFVIGSCIVITRQNKNDLASFALWIFASMLISPNGSTYSLVLLLLPLFALYSTNAPFTQKIILTALVFLISNIPVHYFASAPLLLKFPRLYLMILFFILLLILIKPRYSLATVLMITLLFLGLESPRILQKPDESNYVLQKEEHLLIYDYKLKPGKITYAYWSEKGSQKDSLNFNFNQQSTSSLEVKDQQIYYKGKKLTATSDWKRKPVLIDDQYILYLSDKNKGIGFYTFRKIALDQRASE